MRGRWRFPARHHSYAYQEYVTLERDSTVKHELCRGEIYAMAGGTPGSASLAAAVIRLVGNHVSHRDRRLTLHRRAADGTWSIEDAARR